jgi:hypothetical protein
MARKLLLVFLAALAVGSLSVMSPVAAGAQDPAGAGAEAPRIVPRPNSGTEPTEAGDRGGSLQLMIPVVLAAGVGGAVWHLSRQSRRLRGGAQQPQG